MAVIGKSAANDSARETFFKLLFGRNHGWVCLAFLAASEGKSAKRTLKELFFKYPEELPEMLDAVNVNFTGNNVYFCPQLLAEKRRKKENVETTPVAWSDLDLCEPEEMLVKPTVIVESSPGRFQAYWSFDRPVDPDDAEDLSRRIAYKHADQGADRSGWDLTQLLRVPLTYNYKYETSSDVPTVKVTEVNRALYRLDDFTDYPDVAGYERVDIEMPGELKDPDTLLEGRRLSLNPNIWRLYNEVPMEGTSWSEPLWNLQMMLLEVGFAREEVFSIVRAAKCNKYARDGKSDKLLWKEVCRAWLRNEANINAIAPPKDEPALSLLSDEERQRLANEPDTFIERYMTWAKSLGDAAVQYHQAGAFVALSSLIAGAVKLPTSFGTIIPNLWFMILADTTLTRKSTAMDIAMDMVAEIDPDAVLATDGSIEGLMTSLSTRPGKPSVFLRDEFSGLLEAMTKKDYYAGMPEALTKLYDGKLQKRVLRKETLEVRDPVLIFFAGGIKNKITGLLSTEHVSSGFMPRFIFITAESDITKLKPLGPPTTQVTDNGESIRSELQDIFNHYRREIEIEVKQANAVLKQRKVFDAELTEDAWVRYNLLESDMLKAGLNSDKPEIMTPTHDRLSKSILKCAVLLSAAEQRKDKVYVREIDILRAIRYGEQWRTYVVDVMTNVGRGTMERQMDTILTAIRRTPGVTRSKIMQTYHLTARQANEIFLTLEGRGLISRTRSGRAELIFALERTSPNVR